MDTYKIRWGLYTNNGTVMLDRLVLDTPITLAAGQVKSIPYRFQMSNS